LSRLRSWPILAAPILLLTVWTSPSSAAENGIASKSAAQVVSTAIKTSAAASSFSVDGTVTESSSTIGLNLSVSASGMSEGTITINGGTAHVVELGSVAYFKADNSFWTQNGGKADAQLLAGKWVYGPITSSTFSSFKGFLSPRKIINSFFSGNQGPFKKGGTSSINGQAVLAITGQTAASNGTLYVAATGKPFVVRLQAKGSSGSGQITFTRYNRPVRPTKPAGAINLQQLAGGGGS
jgi:hypothetical protein